MNPAPEEIAAIHRQVSDDVAKVAGEVRTLLTTPSNWSGRVRVAGQRQLRGMGIYFPNGDIGIAAEILDEPHRYWPAVICETIHAHSPGNVHRSFVFAIYPGLEEGLNEKLQRLLRPRILRRLGVQVDEQALLHRDENHAFNRFVDALEAIRVAAGPQAADPLDFYQRMLEQPIDDRIAWLMSLSRHPDAFPGFDRVFAANLGLLRD
ncbi:MAG: hypothetical protein M3347_15975 [Armatimonadota bacterium]|nr:hypothetical protein [Armatimonadota bacterium]